MLNGRKRIIGLVGAALAASVGLFPSAQAEPDIDDVRARVDRLYEQSEQAAEQYHDIKLELDGLKAEVKSLKADERRQDASLSSVRGNVRTAAIRQYRANNLHGTADLLDSDSGDFLKKLTTAATAEKLQSSLLSSYSNEVEAAVIRRQQTEARQAKVTSLEKKLAGAKSTADKKLAEAKSILSDLEAEQREAVLSRGEPLSTSDLPSASGNAAAVVRYAMAQVGEAYVWGAAGPSSFDCSGLTMMAWAQAGVGLPHSSSAQYGSGAHVSQSDLRPGDLVFYYSPISHVGIYIGNGMIVHAANPGARVRVDPLNHMPYVGAVRPG